MTVAAVLDEIHVLSPKERRQLFDAFLSELLEVARREDEEDVGDALAVLNDPHAEWVPWKQVKSELHAHEVGLSKLARKSLLSLRDEHLRSRLETEIDALKDNPIPVGAKELQGAEALYRVRVGDYRIVYVVGQGRLRVLVMKIGDRKEVYR